MIMKYLKKIIGTLLFAATVFLTACGPSGSGSGSIVDIGGSSAPRPNVSGTPDSAETPAPSMPATDVPATDAASQAPTATPALTPEPSSTAAPSPTDAVTPQPSSQPNTGGAKYIYLTFDDGPCENTYRVLDILDRYNVKATFFTVGYFVDRRPEIVRKTVSRGHFVACHSYTHDFSACYASADAFMKEIDKWAAAYEKAVGSPQTNIRVRFPGGSTTGLCPKDVKAEIKARLAEKGYAWFDWNAGNNDRWPQGNVNHLPTKQYLLESYRKSMDWHEKENSPHVVFLCHDTCGDTVDVLPEMIEDLIARGYTFRTIDMYPEK